MTAPTLSIIFHKLVFFLNASFPRQTDGRPLHDQWERCGELASQVLSLLASYQLYRDAITIHHGEPLLLCEVICRCAWYLYEKGQFGVALDMVAGGMLICNAALAPRRHGSNHPGYSRWFAQDMVSHLTNVQATIARERPDADCGLRLAQEVLDIRLGNSKHEDSEGGGVSAEEEESWIAAARGNLAVSLMGVDRTEEALDVLLELLNRADAKRNEDIYLSNAALCLSRLGRVEDAAAYLVRAMESVTRLRGKDTAQMAV
jgi:tetratricopeptide (TPR) repeat protein